MKILRIILVLAVLAYAGWLAWPILSIWLEGSTETAGPNARIAIESADLSGAWLWIVAAVLYVVAALMLGAGNPKAAIAYFLGFLADAALRLAIDRGGSDMSSMDAAPYADSMGADIAARSAQAVAPAGLSVDPTWLVLGVLLVVGVLIVAVSRRRARKRTPGHLAA